MIACPRCQHENLAGSRYCSSCGARLTGGVEPDTALKVVTVLFSDVADSTALGEELDPDALREVLGRYFARMSATIERHGGTVQKFAGDAVLAVFGIPQVREDDALRAVRAAVEIHQDAPLISEEVGLPITLRTGLNTGLVVADQGRTLALGDAVNVAARLEQAAPPGEILLGIQTLRLVRNAVEVEPLGPLRLKGKSDPVEAYRVLGIDRLAPGTARRLDLPLVDRRHELSQLRDAWVRTVQESSCRPLTIVGAAGVGKSRLVEELFRTLPGEAIILRGRCLHYGDGITFWPISEALSAAGQPAEPILRRLSEGRVGTAEELFLEVRRLLELLALERPVILFIDDLQWAEPMLIDLLHHIADLSTAAPILILCNARDPLEEREGWSDRQQNSTLVVLEPLLPTDCERLLDQLAVDLEAEARAHVIRTSEGNPLFVEEMAVLAQEQGIVEMPMTIQSLLSSRIERLDIPERELLARAAVEGQVFHRSAVTELADEGSATQIDTHLRGLVRKDLIRPHDSEVPGDEAYRFRHLLIRDVAYERLPRARRAELHERFADWLGRRASGLAEHDELAGWHLEQAVRYRERARLKVDTGVMRRAAAYLHSAARRAADRGDMVASSKLLQRALALAPAGEGLRLELTAALAERLVEIGDLGRADELLSAAEKEYLEEPSLALSRLLWMFHVHPEEALDFYERSVDRLIAELAQTGNERGVARLHMLGFWMHWTASRAMPAADQARLAAEHALAARDIALRSRALGWYVATLVFGPTGVDTMASELDRIEAESPGPYLQSFADLGRGEVHRLKARFDDAVDLTLRARDGFRSLGISTMAATCEQSLGWIEISVGDADAARDALRRSDDILAEFGERAIRSTTQAMLARAAQMLGKFDEARTALEQADALSSPSDLLNFTITNGVRARLADAAGELIQAEQSARRAVADADGTDFVSYQAQARLLLAGILAKRGREEEALAEARAARDLFLGKGDSPGLTATTAFFDRLRS